MSHPIKDCRSAQRQLLGLALDAPGRAVPEDPAEHLRECPTCQAYQKSLLLAPRLWCHQPLYHPALRMRTMARIDEAHQTRTPRFLPFLILALSLSALTSLVLPVWLLSEALILFFESATLRLGLSIFLAYSLGGAAAGLCTVSLAGRVARGRPDVLAGGAL